MTSKGLLAQRGELKGHRIENNGEDLEYLRALSRLSNESMARGMKSLEALMEQSQADKGLLAEEGQGNQEAKFFRKYNL